MKSLRYNLIILNLICIWWSKIGNDNRFVAVIRETDTGEIVKSEKNVTNIFHILFGLNLRGAGFEIRRYSGKEVSSWEGFSLRQLLDLPQKYRTTNAFQCKASAMGNAAGARITLTELLWFKLCDMMMRCGGGDGSRIRRTVWVPCNSKIHW